MSFKTTLLLLVLAVVGFAVWFFAGQRQPTVVEPEEPAVSEQAKTRYVLEPRVMESDVVRLQIERRDQPRLVFERREKEGETGRMEDWRMVEPLGSRTENYVVSGVVRMLTGLQYRRSFTPGSEGAVSLADAGLEPPTATVTITDKEGTEYAVDVGKKVALSNDMYVRVVGSDEIMVVGRDMTRDIEREVNDYRAKRLMQLKAADARHVQIEHEDATYDFSSAAGKQWVINAPVKAYALPEKIKGLINTLGRIRVEEFVDDAPESLDSYGLESPFLTVSVMTEEKELVLEEPNQPEDAEEPTTQPIEPRFEVVKKEYELAVGGYADLKSETRYVKRADQPWVASVKVDQLEKLIPELAELRDPTVTRIKAADATRLEISAAGTTAVLEKTDGKWHGSGDLAEIETPAVRKVLEAFEDAKAIDYIDDPHNLSEYGLDSPRVVLTVATEGAVEPVTLRIGADTPSGRNTYVQLAGQPTVMVISAERASELAVTPLSLRSRVMTSGTPQQVTKIELEHRDKRYVLEREQNKRWKLLEPADAPPDTAAVRELVTDLSRLRAREVVARGDDGSYGLNDPALTIHFVMEQPVETPAPASQPTTQASQPTTQASQPAVEPVEHTLVIARRAGKTYARIDDGPYVFELDKSHWTVMTQELIRRGLFDVEGEDVAYLRIEAPAGALEFEHDGERWVFVPDPYVQLSQKRVADFVKELAELRVDAYIAYRDGDLAQHGLEDAPVTVMMRLKDGAAITLKVTQVRRGELPRKAAWIEQQRIFLLQPTQTEKLMRGLDHYVMQEPGEDEEGA
jgi:hypothetical protein